MAKASTLNIAEGGCRRIKNAAVKVNRTIFLIGSRANNTFTSQSDFDYVIPGIRSREWTKIKNSLPGAKNLLDGLPNRIDLFKGALDNSLPHFKITPNTNKNECN